MTGLISLAIMIISLAAVVITEKRMQKQLKIIATMALAAIASYIIGAISLVLVNPGIFTAMSFGIMTAYMNKGSFWIFFLLALAMCFFEAWSGSANLFDIAAALPVGLLSFYLIDNNLGMNNGKGR